MTRPEKFCFRRLLSSEGGGGEFRWEGGQLGGKRAEEEEERQRKRREAEEESLAERQELMPFFGSRGKRGKIDNAYLDKGLTVVGKKRRSKEFNNMSRYFYRSI